MEEKELVCPICGFRGKSLKMHLRYKHNMSMEEFRKEFPGFGKTQITPVREKDQQCPYCDTAELFHPVGLGYHIKKHHPEHYVTAKERSSCKEGYSCPVCNKVVRNIEQHITLGHKIPWDVFVEKYQWKGGKAYVSEAHKLALSKQKRAYYASDEGLVRKRKQRALMKGENNISKRRDVRQKLSLNAAKRSSSGTYTSSNFRIGIHSLYKGLHLKSLQELLAVFFLEDNAIAFEYEKHFLLWKDEEGINRIYTPDFKIGDTFYEVKHANDIPKQGNKYARIKKGLLEDVKLDVVSPDLLAAAMVDKGIVTEESINEDAFITSVFKERCKQLLMNGDIRFKQYSKRGRFRFLEELDKNFRTNRNITLKES